MTAGIKPLTKRPAWKALAAHYKKARDLHLRDLFTADPKRGERLTAGAVGVTLDYSKNRITDETLKLLLQLAEESGLRCNAQDLKEPVFPRWSFFQCAASPVRIFRAPAPAPAAGKATPAA